MPGFNKVLSSLRHEACHEARGQALCSSYYQITQYKRHKGSNCLASEIINELSYRTRNTGNLRFINKKSYRPVAQALSSRYPWRLVPELVLLYLKEKEKEKINMLTGITQSHPKHRSKKSLFGLYAPWNKVFICDASRLKPRATVEYRYKSNIRYWQPKMSINCLMFIPSPEGWTHGVFQQADDPSWPEARHLPFVESCHHVLTCDSGATFLVETFSAVQ